MPSLSPTALALVRSAIRLAGGREVCFACGVDDAGVIATARVVARGDASSVLALPGFAERGELLLHNHPSGVLDPSDADLAVAARLHDEGIGFAITDNEVRSVYVVVEVPRRRAPAQLDPATVEADLGPGGPVGTAMRRYEDRPAQRAMAAAVARLVARGGIGLIEAGTGVGKSLGYLVPALRWAAASGERTVVATATIPLQEQLVAKDLPFLREALADQEVRFALLKGWRNYVCLARLDQARRQAPALFEDGVAQEVDAIAAWAERTEDGSTADLGFAPRAETWDEVGAEADLCPRLTCPRFDACFVFKARRHAAQADVVVVNHHLLLADIAVRRAQQNWSDAAVLPAYKRLVIDEAHHLEDAAAGHLGATVTRRGLQRLFGRLERNERGLLPTLRRRLAQRDDLLSRASLDLVDERLAPTVRTARDRAAVVFDLLEQWVGAQPDPTVRLTDAFDDADVWRAGLGGALDDLLAELDLLSGGLRTVKERLDTDSARAEELAPLLNELRGATRRLELGGDALRRTLRPQVGDGASIRWVEARGDRAPGGAAERAGGGPRNVRVASVPLDLAPILREDLFRKVETCVLTSATLAVGEGFGFVRARLGLDEDDVEPVLHTFPSPFDYPRQALLAVPTDAPEPAAPGRAHLAAVAGYAAALADAAGGGVFVLCTSHRDVREGAALLRARGLEARFPLLVHGEAPREALLARFRASGTAVLVGTTTFWEGVDVPGDALRALVLSKIPFRVPSEPVTAAHCEAIEARGGDSFGEYMVPHAALRLKQGFGRLIRTATDRGVIVLADPRVARKAYGERLLGGLPPARRLVGRWADLEAEIRRFYR